MHLKPLIWVGSSKKDVLDFPDEVLEMVGYALYLAQNGERHLKTKVLKNFGGTGVIEILEDHESGTYRTVYTVKFARVVFVLHAFQKKSKQGIATPQRDIELIKRRLGRAQEIYRELGYEGK